jgi:hypothetical protein
VVAAYPLAAYGARSRPTADDEHIYLRYASNLFHHGAFSLSTSSPFRPSVLRTPGYPAFLAALKAVGLGGQHWVIAVQLALIGIAAVATYLVVEDVTSNAIAASAAAVATILYLPLLEYSAFYLSEVLAYSLAAVVTALLLARSPRAARLSVARFAVAGLLLGCLGLVRAEYLLVGVPLVLVVILLRADTTARRGLCVVAAALAFLVVTGPWMGRNAALVDQPLPGGANDGASLYASALQYKGTISPKFTQAEWRVFLADIARIDGPAQARVHTQGRTRDARLELAANAAQRRAASSTARSVPVVDGLKRVPKRLAYLWSIADQPPGAHFALWHHAGQLQYVVYLVLAVVGLVSLRRRRDVAILLSPLLVWPVYLTAVHLVFHVEARYSLPGREFLMVLVGLGVAVLFEAPAARRTTVERSDESVQLV